jgi:transketolase
VIASDGDLMEGLSHEAASLAGALGLGRLVVLYDDNGITIDGPTELSFCDDVLGRFSAYGWQVQRVDGHDLAALHAALREARADTQRPSLIACRTHIGFGSPRQDSAKVHGAPLGEEDLRKTKAAFEWPEEARFFVPQEVMVRFEQARRRGEAAQESWLRMLDGYQADHPELAGIFKAYLSRELPAGWEQSLPVLEEKPVATRVASGKVLDALAPKLPTLVGGSADLTPSNNTLPKGARAVRQGDYSGGYLHFGVREHGMAAALNGLALHGLRPYGGTFLIFSDYMRPSIRLAAMMGLPVIYVFTHDSIGLGEDGPTHQPVEHLTALRAIPNLVVIRPADGRETVEAWAVALKRVDGPTALVLTRQDLPLVTPGEGSLSRGAYVLAETGAQPGANGRGRPPQLVLIATGSEVSLALEARERLSAQGVTARVVSMPSWELFDAQPQAYQEQVLPAGVPRLAIEAGSTLAWPRYLGQQAGSVIGLDHFGASAPYKTLYERFGLIVERIVEEGLRLLESRL